MRILILHSRYLSGPVSGENRVVDEEIALLRDGGHDVAVHDPSPDQFSAVTLAARSLASARVARAIRDRVRNDRIDVVHCHNLYPTLGAGVVRAASSGGAATVLTLHNFRLLCVAGTFFRDGGICQDCLTRSYWPGVVHACYRGSHVQSGVLATSLATARARGTFASVDRMMAVSAFIREKHIEAGFDGDRILVKPNSVPAQMRRDGPGTYFLVLSRLSAEKGVMDIVRAWSSDLGELWIAGDGPEMDETRLLAEGRGVRLIGRVEPAEVGSLIANARAVMVPSRCFEGQPRAILEAYACGVPVVATRIGGLTDVVVDDVTGRTVSPGNLAGWREAASWLADDGTSERMGEGAFGMWSERFNPERGLAALEAAYGDAIEYRNESEKGRQREEVGGR